MVSGLLGAILVLTLHVVSAADLSSFLGLSSVRWGSQMRQFSGKVVMRVRESHGALSNVTAAVLASTYWGVSSGFSRVADMERASVFRGGLQ